MQYRRRTGTTVQIRIDAELYRKASETAVREHRTVRGQLEKWINDGMAPSKLERREGGAA